MEEKNILLIDKPAGITSHDVVDKVRTITGENTVGHAGTLDPAATGLLIVLVGREATKRQAEFMKQDKVYEAEIVLGAVSDTYDGDGVIKEVGMRKEEVGIEKIQEVIEKNFTGEIEQVPPIYSAIRVKGKKLYKYAREGQKVEIKPRKVMVYEIKICHPDRFFCHSGLDPESRNKKKGLDSRLRGNDRKGVKAGTATLNLRIHCSSGTYIRSIANDLGQLLGCGGYLSKLRRIKIGNFDIKDARKLKDLQK